MEHCAGSDGVIELVEHLLVLQLSTEAHHRAHVQGEVVGDLSCGQGELEGGALVQSFRFKLIRVEY